MILFLASSAIELVAACIARRHYRGQRANLLFNLGMSQEPELVRQRVLNLGRYWDKITFIEPGMAPAAGDLAVSALRRLLEELRTCRRHTRAFRTLLRESIGDDALLSGGEDITLCFNHLHHPVFFVLGLLPRAERVYYPHGLDQPRSRQLLETPFYFGPRGWRTMLRTWPSQGRLRKSLYAVRVWLRITGEANLPFPFDGVDRALVFSSAKPGVAFERIPEVLIQDVLREIAAEQDVRGPVSEVFARLMPERCCLLLLPELDTQHPNANYLRALDVLMQAVAAKEPVETFVLKPHPRSSFATYESTLMLLRKQHPDRQILPWPKAAITVQTELVVATHPVRCVASMGSCALPPWTACGVPHYVSRRAAELFDAGWPEAGLLHRVYPSYVAAGAELDAEHIAQTLD